MWILVCWVNVLKYFIWMFIILFGNWNKCEVLLFFLKYNFNEGVMLLWWYKVVEKMSEWEIFSNNR